MKHVFICSFAMMMTIVVATQARAECYGDPGYQVCTETTTDPDGSMHVTSSDSMGNTYSLDSDVSHDPDGGMTVESHDSEGNSYSVHSWSDASGSHTTDSDGNECTITPDGQMIGCGE